MTVINIGQSCLRKRQRNNTFGQNHGSPLYTTVSSPGLKSTKEFMKALQLISSYVYRDPCRITETKLKSKQQFEGSDG